MNLLTTQWNSLPSLDINDTDPDIVYSVELYQITCGQEILMNSETVSKNSTGNEVDPMQIYKVIIAARNNVAEARNGPSEVMTGIVHVQYVEYCGYIHLHVQCAYNS